MRGTPTRCAGTRRLREVRARNALSRAVDQDDESERGPTSGLFSCRFSGRGGNTRERRVVTLGLVGLLAAREASG
jgi:hypothetical protein